MKDSLAEAFGQEITEEMETTLIKTTFLSYYISLYNTVNDFIVSENESVTVNEIYDFIQDLKHESGREIPIIKKKDISFCFYILKVLGVCKDST